MGELAVMDTSGDVKIVWDASKPDEVEIARENFNKMKKKGYVAFEVVGKDGTKGKQIKEFDPDSERIIMAPFPIAG